MNDDFSILSRFLDSLGPEVSGRSATKLSDEQLQQLERFAAGELDAEERKALLPEIVGNEKAVHELVKRVKARD